MRDRAPIGGMVLFGEASRTARRWQTYATRAGFSGGMLGVLLVGIWASVTATNLDWTGTQSAWMGRALFVGFTVLQMVIALFMAPMTTSRAIIEERTEGTLDLLVLTPIQASALLGAKVLSRLVSLVMVVLGSLPLMAMVVTLGGVSVAEVVLVSVGNLVLLATMGVMGAYFGLFTRAPMVATLASTGWALMTFVPIAGLFSLLAARPTALAWMSPFFASAGDWSGLILLVAYLPTIGLAWLLGTRLFLLKMSNAELRRYFDPKLWSTRAAIWAGAGTGISMVTLLPIGVAAAWASSPGLTASAPTTPTGWLTGAIGLAICFAWIQALTLCATWLYLRLGMDLVDAFEGMLDEMGRDRARRRASRSRQIWNNPIAWREARVSAWGRGGLPLVVGWGIVLFAMAQTGVWLIPGGLLILGFLNAAAAILLTVWLAAGSVEQERQGGTLDMLLMTRLTSSRIVRGKLIALAFPTGPMLAISFPMLLIGYPYTAMVFDFDNANAELFLLSVVQSLMVSVWLGVFWVVAALMSMWIAFRVHQPSSAYGAAAGSLFSAVLVPAFLSWSLNDFGWWAEPFRLMVPALTRSPHPVELAVGTVGLLITSGVLYVLVNRAVRTGGGRHGT